MVEYAWYRKPSFKTNFDHELGVFKLPVLDRITGTVHALEQEATHPWFGVPRGS